MTILNALPVKKKMKKAFSENHIFTRFNLDMPLIYHNVPERKNPGAEGSAMVQCCRGTLLMTSRIQHQHDANHLT